MRNALTAAACLVCLAVFIVRGDSAVRATSATFDEAVHLTAGYSYWRTGDFRINIETPPLMKLIWALPLVVDERPPFAPDPELWEKNRIWRMGDAFLYESPASADAMLLPARRMNLAVGAMLVLLVGWWALRMWGRAAAVAGWAVAALDPNLIGQSAVLSTDVGLALVCTAAAYALWEYAGSPRRGWFLLAGICLGLALATKFSALAAVAGCLLGAILLVLSGGSMALPGRPPAADRPGRLKALVPLFVRLGLVAFVVVVLAYYIIQSPDWARGLRQQLGRHDFEPPKYYLNGEFSTRGWWWYFPEVIGLKTPAGTLVLAALSVVGLSVGKRLTRRDVAFLVVPATFFFLAMAAARINIGIRVILPAYPLLWLLAARVATFDSIPSTRWLAGLVLTGGVLAPPLLDPASSGDRSISYFNGLVTGRADGHRYLGDSNLDWGQGLKALAADLRAHGDPVIYLAYAGTARPEAFGIRYERLITWGQFRDPPTDRVDLSGKVLVAVSVSNLQGTTMRDAGTFRWLLERKPISRTDDSIWLFDVTGDAEAIERVRAALDRRKSLSFRRTPTSVKPLQAGFALYRPV